MEDPSYPAIPYPYSFNWTKNGVPVQNDSNKMFGYPTVRVRRFYLRDSGNYTLTARNYENNGTSTGSFSVNVLGEIKNWPRYITSRFCFNYS